MPKDFDARSVHIDGKYVVNKPDVYRTGRGTGSLSETPISLQLVSYNRFKVDINIFVNR